MQILSGRKKVTDTIEKLFVNLSGVKIPVNILHRYMPIQYEKVIRGQLEVEPRKLAKDGVLHFVMDYEYAVHGMGSKEQLR